MKRQTIGGHGVLLWQAAGADAQWLHFAHATGMCAELYAELLAPLAGRFNIVASDARGHGQSDLPADPAALTSWRTYEDDLAALLARFPAGRWLLAGHSMGASVSLELAARRPGLATAVVLVEPAFIPFALAEGYEAARAAGTPRPNPMAEQAGRRRASFPSRQAARDNWHGRGVFQGWPGTALDAYVAGGMRDIVNGAELACAPAWEAATFAAVTTSLEASLAAAAVPVAMIHGTLFSTVTEPDAAAFAAAGATVERIDGASHFLPLEHPGRVRAAIEAVGRPGTRPAAATLTL